MDLQVDRLLDVAHAVHVRIAAVLQLFLCGLNVFAQALDQGAAIVAKSLLQSPAVESKQRRHGRLSRYWDVRFQVHEKQIALESGAILRHDAVLDADTGADVL